MKKDAETFYMNFFSFFSFFSIILVSFLELVIVLSLCIDIYTVCFCWSMLHCGNALSVVFL